MCQPLSCLFRRSQLHLLRWDGKGCRFYSWRGFRNYHPQRPECSWQLWFSRIYIYMRHNTLFWNRLRTNQSIKTCKHRDIDTTMAHVAPAGALSRWHRDWMTSFFEMHKKWISFRIACKFAVGSRLNLITDVSMMIPYTAIPTLTLGDDAVDS